MTGQQPYSVDIRKLDALSTHELYALLKQRVDVFVVEQNCSYPELDGKDGDAFHLRLLNGGALLASARIFEPSSKEGAARIGRLVVSPEHRGKRLGDAVMREAIAFCDDQFAYPPIVLSAQSHLERFYASFGFDTVSDAYMEDGIPHVDMLRPGLKAS